MSAPAPTTTASNILTWINLILVLGPKAYEAGAELVMLIRSKDGSMSILDMNKLADSTFDKTTQENADWLASHGIKL